MELAGKTFSTSAPASQALKISLGVITPAHTLRS